MVGGKSLACLVIPGMHGFSDSSQNALIWNVRSFLDQAQGLVKAAIEKYAAHKIVEFNMSCLFRKGAASGRRIGKQMSINMHTMGTSFAEQVRDMQ